MVATGITRFVAYLPDAAGRDGHELGLVKARVGAAELSTRRESTWLFACDGSARVVTAAPPEVLLDVFPGTLASARFRAAALAEAATFDELHRTAEASAQCYNLIEAGDRHFRLESDAIGLKPAYIARTDGGTVIASRIADLLQLFPDLAASTDTTALYEMFGFWAPLANRTLHRRIRRMPPGGCCRWTPDEGLTVDDARRLGAPAVDPMQLLDQAVAAIHEASRESMLEKAAGATQPLTLALSGGFDSRYVAALCRDLHIDVRAVTHGLRRHREFHSARAIARTLGTPLRCVGYRKDVTLRDLPQFLDVTEGTADPAALSIMNVFDGTSAAGTPILHGFYGDHLAGERLDQYRAAELSSRDALADAVIRHYFPPERPDLGRVFEPKPDLDEMRQDVLDGLRADCPAHQAYLLWYSDNRTRRYVGSQAALLGARYDVIMPFYDRRLVQRWWSLPPMALAGRYVFRRLLARYYPALARIPHPEESVPVIPNLRWQLANLCGGLPQRLLAGAIGDRRAQAVRRRLYRDPDILSLSKLAAPQQRAYMVARLAALRPVLEKVLGVALSPGFGAAMNAPTISDPQALRSTLAVACYADRLNRG